VISTSESLRIVMACYPDGLIIAKTGSLRSDEGIIGPVADVIEADTVPIPLPPETRIRAFHWEHPMPGPAPTDCAALPEINGPPPATDSPPA
jgi:hypothetical protein